jgi:hypothetical protein
VIAPQGRDGGDLSWLFQLVAVFVFFVLPVLRSIAETRKKAREGQAGRAPRPPRAPAPRSGRDLWRDLLEGRVEPPAATPPKPVRRPVPASPPVQPQPTPRPLASLESVPVELAPRVEDTRLEVSIAPRASELAAPGLDPATLDDELVSRWQAAAAPAARAEPSPALAALLGGGDWRRAVLLSELLAPPLALRGPASAWPGPPAGLNA